MEICYREMTAFEAVPLALFADRPLSDEEFLLIRRWCEFWPRRQTEQEHLTQDYQPRLRVDHSSSNDAVIRMFVEWCPPHWIGAFGSAAAEAFPFVHRLEVGTDFTPPPFDPDSYIDVGPKSVPFGSCDRIPVARFGISRWPISVGQFLSFADATGYVTVAERVGFDFTFRCSPGQEIIPEHKRVSLTARFLSHQDADAYCAWVGQRLPTEAEGLAAAIIDDRECLTKEEELERYRALKEAPNALKVIGQEITGTLTGDNKVIIRSGPALFRRAWEQPNAQGYRQELPVTCFHGLQFRVCRQG
jgi:hypothetical protein